MTASTPIGKAPARHAWTSPALALIAALLLGLVLRIWLNARSAWMIDGDEALFGIGALRLLQGHPPNLLYGVPYLGMLQSYLAAPFVALLGPTPAALRSATLLTSLAYIAVTWLLAREWYGHATAAVAALFAAVPSVYFDVVGLKVWGSYVDVMALGGLILLGAWRSRSVAGGLPPAAWLTMGVLAGLAMWANLLVAYYLATALLLLPWGHARRWLPRAAVFGLLGGLLGGLPLWWFNVAERGATFHWLLAGAGTAKPETGAVEHVLWTTLLPRVVGLTSPWAATPAVLSVSLAVVLACSLALAVDDARRQWRSVRRSRPPAATPALLFLVVSLAIYSVSGFGRPSLTPFDASGRYLLPVWTALPILLAAFCVRLAAFWPPLAVASAGLVVSVNMFSHLIADPGQIFQSPYWNRLPADNRPLIRWLEDHQVHTVWMNHWAGDQVIYESGGRILTADYYDIVAGHGIDRLPTIFQGVAASRRSAFVLVSADPSRPPLAARVQALGVAAQHASLGAYQIVLPLSRRVDPAEVEQDLAYPN